MAITPYARESAMLRALLSGAWESVSADFVENLMLLVSKRDIPGLTSLMGELPALGTELRSAISTKTDAILSTLQVKASSFWISHGRDALGRCVYGLSQDYQDTIREIHAKQIKLFSEKFPERILQPEIARQLEYLRDAESTRSIDVGWLAERLERITSKDSAYWENLSDVQVARQWHANGIFLGRENGVKTGIIVGPEDKKTCLVCFHMLGLEISIPDTAKKLDAYLNTEDDVDAYTAAWPFPRLGDVDNISREDLAAKGFMPPFHPRCRHHLAFLK